MENLSLTIGEGEIYGLIGPNGAGKTTSIRMACGLLTPTSGEVFVAGVNVDLERENAQRYIGYLSDFFSLYEDLKVWEYLDYFAHAYKMPEVEIPRRIGEVIEQVGLEPKRGVPIRGLSRGMKQRLGVARAIIHHPKVLLLDEPASGLDPKSRLELRSLLLALRDQGATILISSHILSELEGFCTSIGIMERGRMVRSGRIEEVTAADNAPLHIKLQWIGDEGSHVQQQLSKVNSITEIELASSGGTFRFAGSRDQLPELLAALINAGVRVSGFVEIKETVEDIYMRISTHEVM